MDLCPICKKDDFSEQILGTSSWFVNCNYCGQYYITPEANRILYPKQRNMKLSIITRLFSEVDKPISITSKNIQTLVEEMSFPQYPLEYVDELLLYMRGKTNAISDIVEFEDFSHLLIKAETQEILELTLANAEKLGYISNEDSSDCYRIDLKGWDRLKGLERINKDSKQAFVAMWFDAKMDESYEKGFKAALEECGFKPIRVDSVEHNGKIDDKIISEIKRSGLIIADFTGNRGGVYYEAGFAQGLGIPVIWTCKKSNINKVHFDTRQYNHIVWKEPSDLKEQLINRVRATIL